MSFDFSNIANEVAAVSADTNVAKSGGGGSYTPPPKGLARLRLIGYIELGKQIKKVKGKPDKVEDTAWLVFELSGKGYEPKVLDDGTKIPFRITVKLNKSLNEKATYFKLFKRMNYEGKAKHFSQLLGQPFLGNVGHFIIKNEGKDDTIIANFRDDSGNLTIRPPRIETVDEETGDVVSKVIPVDPPVSDMRLFVWDSKPEWLAQMWASIHIPDNESDGEADEDGKEKRSRNVYQNTIKAAQNFEGSPVHQWLQANGADLGIPDAGKDTGPVDDDDDILNNVG